MRVSARLGGSRSRLVIDSEIRSPRARFPNTSLSPEAILINDMAGCHFDPGILTCRGPKTPSCLTQDQVTAMREVMQGPLDEAGKPIYRSFPYDAGFVQGWRVIHLGTSPTAVSNSFEATMGLVTLQYHSLTPPDPRLDPLTFSFLQALARVAQTAAMNDADWTFLNTFAAHGKLILYQGMSDYSLSANQLAAWYDRLHTDTRGTHSGLGEIVPRPRNGSLRRRPFDRPIRPAGCDRELDGARESA